MVTTLCNFPYRGYGYEGHGYNVWQEGQNGDTFNLVEEIYYDFMDTRAIETFDAVGGYTDGLETPEFTDDSYAFYFCDACNAPYLLANAYSDYFDIATCALVFGKGDDVDYTEADLTAYLNKYRDRGITVVEDSTTYTITVYDMEFVSEGYTLSLEAYLINGYIRLEVGFKGYEIPVRDYTAVEVVQDINDAFAGQGYTFGLEWDDDDKAYELGLNFGSASAQTQAVLAEPVEIIVHCSYKSPKLGDLGV